MLHSRPRTAAHVRKPAKSVKSRHTFACNGRSALGLELGRWQGEHDQADGLSRRRATTSRLQANTEAWTYALKEARPFHRHRSSPNERLRYEMTPSTPARKFRRAR